MNRFFLPIMAGFCGAITAFMLIGPMKLPTVANYLICGVVTGVAVYFAHSVQKYIKTIGTALIGAFLLGKGISQFVGGFPKLFA